MKKIKAIIIGLLICLLFSCNASATFEDNVKAAPFEGEPLGDVYANEQYNFLVTGHQTRFMQTGDVNYVRFYSGQSVYDYFYVSVWTENGTSFDRVSISDDLSSLISVGENIIKLENPISANEGDYFAVICDGPGGSAFDSDSTTSGNTIYYETGVDIRNEITWDWETNADVTSSNPVIVEFYMNPPEYVFIGDSVAAGHPAHYSFIEDTNTTNINSSISYHFGGLANVSYQNRGIGSQTSVQIESRFERDVINVSPDYVVIEGCLNDVALSKQESLDAVESMISQSVNAGIIPIWIEIPSSNSSTEEFHIRKDEIQEVIETEFAVTYPTLRIVPVRDYVSVDRTGYFAGNLWDLNPLYAADSIHYNEQGYYTIAEAVYEYKDTPYYVPLVTSEWDDTSAIVLWESVSKLLILASISIFFGLSVYKLKGGKVTIDKHVVDASIGILILIIIFSIVPLIASKIPGV